MISIVFLNNGCHTSCNNPFTCERGSRNIVNRSVITNGFNKIILEGSGNVFVKQGDSESVRIETDDNLQQFIKTNIGDSILEFTSEGSICPTKLNFYVTIKSIKGFRIDGSGDLKTETPINASNIIFTIQGSGNIKCRNLTADNAKAEIIGSGDIEIAGSANQVFAEVDGSGNIDCSGLESQNAKIEIAGSGDCIVIARDELYVNIAGSGNVYYIGNPGTFRSSKAGSGDVIAKNK